MELKAEKPGVNIEILGINDIGSEPANEMLTSERSLPWLQDTEGETVWGRWEVTYRDLRIINSQNYLSAVFNLTEHDLSLSENRARLKELFLEAAQVTDSDEDGLPDDWELRYFGNLSANRWEDPDGDGASNLDELAFGTKPNDAKSSPKAKPALVFKGGQGFLSVSFRRPAGTIFQYFVETSTDLKVWTPSSTGGLTTETSRNLFDGTGTSETTVSFTKPIADSPARFLRVRAASLLRP